MTAHDEPELPEFLDRLSRALLEAIDRAQVLEDRDREPLLGLLRMVLEAVHAAARALQGRPATPEALSQWSHSLREPVTVVAAWVQMLALGLNEAKHAQGREAIERNARILLQRLAEPPV